MTNTGDRWSIRFDTTSHELAQGVASLLARIGVAAVIGAPTMSGVATKPLYRVSVCQSPENMRRFAEVVQPIGVRGKRLDGMLAGLTDRATRNSIFVLPSAIGSYAAANYRFRDQDKALSRQKAQDLLSQKHDEVLAAYCESDLIWDEIRSIEPCGEEEVFDITIPGLNCFIANGIVVHNSGSIEQDADSVVFVYREEYYLRKSRPREDAVEAHGKWEAAMRRWEGVAEVIVGKNRHGPEGTVELGFDAQFTRFTNEPPWRSPDPDEARKKKVKLTSHGEALREILRELATVVGSRPTAADLEKKPGLPPNAMLIPRNEVKTVFFERVVADLPPAEAAKKLQAAADNLRHNKLTESLSNAEGVKVVYLVELIAE